VRGISTDHLQMNRRYPLSLVRWDIHEARTEADIARSGVWILLTADIPSLTDV
jgi:hypothetical protein